MNSLRNKVQLIGHIGKDPELKTFDSGKVKFSTSLATNEVYKNSKGDKVTETQWHNIIAWGKTAEMMEKLIHKGKEVMVTGKLKHENYEDKDGNRRNFTQVVVGEFMLIGKPEAKS